MPYLKRAPQRDLATNHEQLVSAIASELRNEKTLSQRALEKAAPLVIEEQMRNSDRLQVYVVWSGWLGVREDHRTSAIVDAYERVLGPDYAKRVVIALGLLPSESKELGIQEQ